MSDARSRYERWTKDQLVEEMVKYHRGRSDDQLHRRALQQKIERANQLRAKQILEIDAALRNEHENPDDVAPMSQLIHAVWDTIQAGEALSSAPIENTMRVTHPTSAESGDGKSTREGRPTLRFRRMIESVRYHVDKATDTITNNLEYDPQLSSTRRDAAFYRHHKDGKHESEPREGCVDCESEAS